MIVFFVSLGIYILIAYLTLLYLGFSGERCGADKLDVIIGIFWPIALILTVFDFFYELQEKYDLGNRIKNMKFVRCTANIIGKAIYFLSIPFRPYTLGKIVYDKMINRKYKKESEKQRNDKNGRESFT